MNILERLDGLRKLATLPEGRIHTLRGSSPALFLALIEDGPFAAITDTEENALKLFRDLDFYLRLLNKDPEGVYLLPDPESPDAAGRRAEFVLRSSRAGLSVISSKSAISAPLWPEEDINRLVVDLTRNIEYKREELEEKLFGMGYRPAPLVTEPGQFKMKGWILDLFPVGMDEPVRVEFFGDEIDTIRHFDVETQLHTSDLPSALVLPAKEPEAGEGLGLGNYWVFGIEGREGLPEDAVVLSRAPIKGEGGDAGVLPLAGYGVLQNERRDITELAIAVKRLRSTSDVLFALSSEAQAKRIKDILAEDDVHAPILAPPELADYAGRVALTVHPLSAGMALPGFFIFTDKDLFGEKPAWKPMKKSRLSGLIQNLDDLSDGDLVVHADHGIGRFMGFLKETTDGHTADFMLIEYAEGSRLYVPLYGIEKVHKYRSPAETTPPLDKLGGKGWEKRKARAKKRLKDIADKLVKIYAEREASKGFAFSPDTDAHREFASFFPYEETPDQLRSIAEVTKDMESARPMERLLCGDVGYGKTEVAMRAAFKCVYDAKQAVVLVPTTLLCEQHFRTFSERFSAFPVKVDYVSRFKDKKEKVKTLQAFEKGEIDILIGTHALLKAELSFANAGLLIIDEEHRFGVAHKERIKEFRKNVDVLLLTATPIPRTLQMALSGIRDMSVIETPPEERLAVKSTVSVFGKQIIKDALEKELSRGGQAFFVHNRIEDIEKYGMMLRDLLPTARIGLAHGRMPEAPLEKTMLRFLDGELDILLSTAIIGSGLDIPNANTMIVDRADMMGLADLYQLRGRVGRGNRRAYAWFLVPGYDILTEDARKRLQALEELSYLGAGFRVALKDLEIRGAGNMLGAEQSGCINDLGFEMYLDILETAVAELKGEEVKEKAPPSLELNVDALVPETYIEDIALRLSFYRRIASSADVETLKKISDELYERFGPLPEEVNNLITVMSLRHASERANIALVRQINGRIRFKVAEGVPPPVQLLLEDRELAARLKFLEDGFEVKLAGAAPLDEVSSVLAHLTPGSGSGIL